MRAEAKGFSGFVMEEEKKKKRNVLLAVKQKLKSSLKVRIGFSEIYFITNSDSTTLTKSSTIFFFISPNDA